MAGAKYLLDTHCLIWFQLNNGNIPENVIEVIQNPDNIILFSQVSLFEIAIKKSIGKLPSFDPSVEEVNNQALEDGFTFVQVRNEHLFDYSNVPLSENHRDPFDRLLIATAMIENATILTADEKFKQYGELISVLWE